MNLLLEAGQALQKITCSDPRLRERRIRANLLRTKFDRLLGGSRVISGNILDSMVGNDSLPILIGSSGIEVVLSKGLMDLDEYFCSLTDKQWGFGYLLQDTKCKAFPITMYPLARRIYFDTENQDFLGKNLQGLLLGHRLADALKNISERNPGLFREGFSSNFPQVSS